MFDPVDRLPYIPPPDYTLRYKPKTVEPRRPQPKDDHGKPHHYAPEIKKPPPKTRPISTSIDDEPMEEPRNQSPEEIQRRVLRMLKEQGVPVFPTAPLKQVVEQGNALGPTRAYIKHLENHRKYDTLKSFRSCDNCALCKQMQKEIRILEHGIPKKQNPNTNPPRSTYYQPAPDYNQQEPVQNQYYHQNQPIQPQPTQPQQIQPHHHKKRSSGSRSEIISGRLFEPLPEVEVEEFPDEPEEFAEEVVERNTKLNGMSSVGRSDQPYLHRHNLSVETHTSQSTGSPPEARRRIIRVPEARVRRDFKAESPQQLSVDEGERVKVLQTDTIWSLCSTERGEMGWVPTNNLRFEHSSSLGSSPGST